MLTPYSRGRGTWEEHLKSIEYLEAIHELSGNIQSEIDLKVSDDTLEKIASHEALFSIFKERYNQHNRTIKDGFSILKQKINRDFNLVQSLRAEFDFGQSLSIDRQFLEQWPINEFLEEINLSNLPKQKEVYVKKGFHDYKQGLYIDALFNFLNATETDSNYHILYRIGQIYLNAHSFVNTKEALNYFTMAGRYAASANNQPFAAVCYLHAAFAAYLLTQDSDSLEYSQKAILLDSTLSEAYYLHAKVEALQNNALALVSIKRAINSDEKYCLKVSADQDFDSIRTELFRQLQEEARKKAEPFVLEVNKLYEANKRFESYLKKFESYGKDVNHLIEKIGLKKLFQEFYNDWKILFALIKRDTYFDYKYFKKLYDELFTQWETMSPHKEARHIYNSLLKFSIEQKRISKEFKSYRKSMFVLAMDVLISIVVIISSYYCFSYMLNTRPAGGSQSITLWMILLFFIFQCKYRMKHLKDLRFLISDIKHRLPEKTGLFKFVLNKSFENPFFAVIPFFFLLFLQSIVSLFGGIPLLWPLPVILYYTIILVTSSWKCLKLLKNRSNLKIEKSELENKIEQFFAFDVK